MQPISVSKLTAYLNQVLTLDPILSDTWVTGEVSGARESRGHLYFDLIEGDAKIRCALFKFQRDRQRVTPRDGEEITVHGNIDYWAQGGSLSLKVDVVEKVGLGLISLEFERLRQRLEAEGLFEVSRKRPLPPAPKFIGVITSAEGSVRHDIEQVLQRRYPLTQVLLAPTKVQGEGAPEGIAEAFQTLAADGRSEVIILARGGGSAEDLSAFNTEIVARAIFASPVPVVTGVGHETDTTIADMVADRRAATPSVAAELVSPNIDDISWRVVHLRDQIGSRMQDILEQARGALSRQQEWLVASSPSERIAELALQVEIQRATMSSYILDSLRDRTNNTGRLAELLGALSPFDVLARGYAVVSDPATGRPLSTIDQFGVGDGVRITVSGGHADGTITLVSR